MWLLFPHVRGLIPFLCAHSSFLVRVREASRAGGKMTGLASEGDDGNWRFFLCFPLCYAKGFPSCFSFSFFFLF